MITTLRISALSVLGPGLVAPVLAYRGGAFVVADITELQTGDAVPLNQLGETRRVDGGYISPRTFPVLTPELPQGPIVYPSEGIPIPALPHTYELLGAEEVVVVLEPLALVGGDYQIRENQLRRVSLSVLAAAYESENAGIGVWIIGSTFVVQNS